MYGCLKWKVPFCRGTPPTGGMFFYLHYQPTPILYPTVNEKFTAIVPTIHCMTKPAFVWYGEVADSASRQIYAATRVCQPCRRVEREGDALLVHEIRELPRQHQLRRRQRTEADGRL